MMNIAEIRAKYPMYDDLSDEQLATAFYNKYYSDMDKGEFFNRIGLGTNLKPLTEEQKAQPKENPYEWVNNPAVRGIAALAQGVSNAGLNPAGYLARALGVDTRPIKDLTATERALEKGGEYGFDAAGIATTGGIAEGAGYLGKGTSLASNVAKSILAPSVTEATALASAGGAAEGLVNPQTELGKTAVNLAGGLIPAGIAGASAKTTRAVQGGLRNALKGDETTPIIARGIKASKAVAKEVENQAPRAYSELNEESVDKLNKILGGKVDVKGEVQSAKKAYNDFITENKGKQLLPDTSYGDEEQFITDLKNGLKKSYGRDWSWQFGKSGDGQGYSQAYNKSVNAILAEEEGKATDSEIVKALKKYPEFKNLTTGDLKGVIKPSEWHHTGKNFKETNYYDVENLLDYDSLYKKSGLDVLRLKSANNKALSNLFKKLKDEKGIDLSTRAKIKEFYEKNTPYRYPEFYKDFSLNKARDRVLFDTGYSEYPELQKQISDIEFSDQVLQPTKKLTPESLGFKDLTSEDKSVLNRVWNTAKDRTNEKVGSLEHLDQMSQELRALSNASRVANPLGVGTVATPETIRLDNLKTQLDDVITNSGLKDIRTQYAKAKGLEDAYNAGFKLRPSERKIDSLNLDTQEKKYAYLQGTMDKILDNVKSGDNISKSILKEETTFRDLLPKDKYQELMNFASENNRQYGKLSTLLRKSTQRTDTPDPLGRPITEYAESKGALLATPLEYLSKMFYSGKNKRKALQYLNPETTEIAERLGLKGAGQKMSGFTARQLADILMKGEE